MSRFAGKTAPDDNRGTVRSCLQFRLDEKSFTSLKMPRAMPPEGKLNSEFQHSGVAAIVGLATICAPR
ncbi:hypothetical protein [Paraburkholderia sp.]|uniref:hypothetical protein n=1 Tax=Paraburkholderia sp. TaxID=1926495 RepID=UPI0025F2AEA6|nr:hypothetical protein [Paraburkholderia sp.]